MHAYLHTCIPAFSDIHAYIHTFATLQCLTTLCSSRGALREAIALAKQARLPAEELLPFEAPRIVLHFWSRAPRPPPPPPPPMVQDASPPLWWWCGCGVLPPPLWCGCGVWVLPANSPASPPVVWVSGVSGWGCRSVRRAACWVGWCGSVLMLPLPANSCVLGGLVW